MDRPILALNGIDHRYGDGFSLSVDGFDVREGEHLVVMGPNGSGKSTLLRLLALIERPQAGTVEAFGRRVDDGHAAALRRRIACVFQEPLLFSVTALENVVYPLRLRGIRGSEAERAAHGFLELMGVAPLAGRHPSELSGGESRRVSLARALACRADVLLLDEPLSALDEPSRDELIREVLPAVREATPTFVYVTHSRDEARALANRLAVMVEGRIVQDGPVETVFATPATEAVARIVGADNLIAGTIIGRDQDLAIVRVGEVSIAIAEDISIGHDVLCSVRPEEIVVTLEERGATSARNRLIGAVDQVTPSAGHVRLLVDVGFPLAALVSRRSFDELELVEGKQVCCEFKATSAHLIRRDEKGGAT